MWEGATRRYFGVIATLTIGVTLVVLVLGVRSATAEQSPPSSSCIITGAHRLTRPLRVFESCRGDGGDVSALPTGAEVVVDEYPTGCSRTKAAVRFEGQWYHADAQVLREALGTCSSSTEQTAEILARACLRGELDACRALRQQEKQAALAALEADASDHEQDATKIEDEDPLHHIPVITKTSCALRAEADLYAQQIARLKKGRRCTRLAEEPPYFKVSCDNDKGWAVSSCFDALEGPEKTGGDVEGGAKT